MKAAVAVALTVVGLAVALVVWLRWSVPARVTEVSIAWAKQLEAPALERVQFTVGDVQFVQARASRDDVRSFAVLRRGADVAVLPDVTGFHFARRDGRHLWAVAEDTTEGPGPSLLVLHSEDGVTFSAWELQKPTYLGVVDGIDVQADAVVVRCSGDQRMFLTEGWWWELSLLLPSAVRPLDASDTFSFRTRDGGRTWRLAR